MRLFLPYEEYCISYYRKSQSEPGSGIEPESKILFAKQQERLNEPKSGIEPPGKILFAKQQERLNEPKSGIEPESKILFAKQQERLNEPKSGIEPPTPFLPRTCSASELLGLMSKQAVLTWANAVELYRKFRQCYTGTYEICRGCRFYWNFMWHIHLFFYPK